MRPLLGPQRARQTTGCFERYICQNIASGLPAARLKYDVWQLLYSPKYNPLKLSFTNLYGA